LNRAPEAPTHWNPKLPARLEEIILKALEKDRRFRYQFAAEIARIARLKERLAASSCLERSFSPKGLQPASNQQKWLGRSQAVLELQFSCFDRKGPYARIVSGSIARSRNCEFTSRRNGEADPAKPPKSCPETSC